MTDEDGESLAKRRRNAEAQASFRARRQSYIKSLEQTVSGLEDVVAEMQNMCKSSTEEAKLLRERVTVFEGVINELTTRLEKSAANAQQKTDHCECCRFALVGRQTPRPMNSRSVVPPVHEYGVNGGGSGWCRQPYHHAFAESQNMGGPHQRLETVYIQRHHGGGPGVAPESGATSSRESSATTSEIRDNSEFPPYFDIGNMFGAGAGGGGFNPPPVGSMGRLPMSESYGIDTLGLGVPQHPHSAPSTSNPDAVAQQVNLQAFLEQHLEPHLQQIFASDFDKGGQPIGPNSRDGPPLYSRSWSGSMPVFGDYKRPSHLPEEPHQHQHQHLQQHQSQQQQHPTPQAPQPPQQHQQPNIASLGNLNQQQMAYLFSLGSGGVGGGGQNPPRHTSLGPPSVSPSGGPFIGISPSPDGTDFTRGSNEFESLRGPMAVVTPMSNHSVETSGNEGQGEPSTIGGELSNDGIIESNMDELDATPSPPKSPPWSGSGGGSKNSEGGGMSAAFRRKGNTTDRFGGLDPIAACSASGSSKTNGLPAKVARCEKTLMAVQAALTQVKEEAQEAQIPLSSFNSLKRRRVSEGDILDRGHK